MGKALDGAGGYVDFAPQAKGAAIYRLMAPGEAYLDSLDHDGAAAREKTGGSKATKPKTRSRRTPTKPKAAKITQERDLRSVVLEQTAGEMSPDEALGIARRMVRDRRVLGLEGGRMTTLAIRAQEQAIERRIAALTQPAGRDVGDAARAGATHEVAERIARRLSPEQNRALRTLTGAERVAVLVGPAGTGMSTAPTTRTSAKLGRRFALGNPSARWRTTRPAANSTSWILAMRPARPLCNAGRPSPNTTTSVRSR
jgi:flagellar biosynthesis GTPase FlhF